jgi:hypothetical protein
MKEDALCCTLLVPNLLYVGSERNAADRELLIERNISAIVNAAAPQTTNHFQQEASCYRYHSVHASSPPPPLLLPPHAPRSVCSSADDLRAGGVVHKIDLLDAAEEDLLQHIEPHNRFLGALLGRPRLCVRECSLAGADTGTRPLGGAPRTLQRRPSAKAEWCWSTASRATRAQPPYASRTSCVATAGAASPPPRVAAAAALVAVCRSVNA